MTFELDERLAKDSVLVTELALCQVRLMRDCNYPWYLLIPQHTGLVEMTDLSEADYKQLCDESFQLSKAIQQCHSPDKLNVAALGNIVSQLHVHHIARFTNDPAWPNPVWGQVSAQAYTDEALLARVNDIKKFLI